MIGTRIKYLAGMFGDVGKVSVNPQTMKEAIDLFSDHEMLPSTFQEIGPGGQMTRLMMSSPDSGLSVRFGTNRVDVTQHPLDFRGTNLGDLSDFKKHVDSIAALVCGKYGFLFNRVSLVAEYFLPSMTDEKLNSVREALLPLDINVGDPNVNEWNFRHVAQSTLQVLDATEMINSIVIVGRGQGRIVIGAESEDFDLIRIELDVNTVQENTNTRLGEPGVSSFMDSAMEIHAKLLKNLEALVNV